MVWKRALLSAAHISGCNHEQKKVQVPLVNVHRFGFVFQEQSCHISESSFSPPPFRPRPPPRFVLRPGLSHGGLPGWSCFHLCDTWVLVRDNLFFSFFDYTYLWLSREPVLDLMRMFTKFSFKGRFGVCESDLLVSVQEYVCRPVSEMVKTF